MRYFIFLTGVIILILTALTSSILGQDTLWTRTYSSSGFETAYDLQLTDDRGFVLACDRSIVKTDSLGDTLWISRFVGDPFHRFNAIFELDNGYMVAGSVKVPPKIFSDFLLAKINGIGDSLWGNSYGGEEAEYAYSADKTNDGGYILAGKTYASEYDDATDILVVKTDSLGDTLWTQTYGTYGTDYAKSISQTSDGGYIIAGYRSNAEAGYLIKTDGYGEEEWYVLEMEGSGSIFYSAKQTSDGGYIAAGSKEFWGYPPYFLYYLVKYDSLGNKEWERTYEDGIFIDSGAWDVCQTIDGGYLIVGYRYIPYERGASRVIRTDPQGDTLWTWRCDEPDHSNAFLSLTTINKQEFAAAGDYDNSVWLAKFQEPSCCCEVDMIPDDDPVVVQPGGSFGYTGSLINPTEFSLTFDVWVGVNYDNQFFQTRLFEGAEPLEPGEFLTRHFRQNVPNYAPIGDYRYIAYGGNYPSKCDSVWFDFTVEGAPLAEGNTEWSVMETAVGAGAPTGGREGDDLPPTLQINGSPNTF
ncbi:MAG: hypothetical protein GF315_02150, partial [candidate division Zixibacteria bacterium]|nr:hypothetical protein [candidate division Zixibacteria bacterium]